MKNEPKLKRLESLSPISHTDSGEFRNLFPKGARKHVGRMRLSLALEIIEKYKGDPFKSVVADPMAGTGVTGVAAALSFATGFIGAELNEEFACLAEEAVQTTLLKRRRKLGSASPGFYCSIFKADAGNVLFHKCLEPIDILFTSPPFPNSHYQGTSDMQKGMRAAKQLYAGTRFDCESSWGIGVNPDRSKWINELVRVLNPWVSHVRTGGVILIHVKNYVRDQKKVRVDLWTKAALRQLSNVRVIGYHPIPLSYRSFFQTCGRYHKRVVVDRVDDPSKDYWLETLACGHTKKRKRKRTKELPKRAVCTACGAKKGYVEIREERIVVARKKG